MSSRRKAREAVLRAIYLSESREINFESAFDEMENIDREIESTVEESEIHILKPFSLGLDNKQKAFAHSLAEKIEENKEILNDKISSNLKNWDFSRISRIDRIILWIALAEISYMFDIPINVSINEAIELAKKYSSEKSYSFVNGILDASVRDMKTDIST